MCVLSFLLEIDVRIGCAKQQGVCAKCRCRVDQTVGRCVLYSSRTRVL